MGEKRHLILTDNQRKADKICNTANNYYVKVDRWFDKRSNLFFVEIVSRDIEWNVLKKVLPRVRKEGYVYGA